MEKKVLFEYLRDGGVPSDARVASVCFMIAVIVDVFEQEEGRYVMRLTNSKNTKKSFALPPIHSDWKDMIRRQHDMIEDYRDECLEGFCGFKAFLTDSEWSVCVVDHFYLNHKCGDCPSLYRHEINKLRCQKSNHNDKTDYSVADMERCWDDLTHAQRKRCTKDAAQFLTVYVDDPLLLPEYTKLVSIVRGNVGVSGSALVHCLASVTEGTHTLRTTLTRGTLREPITRQGGCVAMMAHELCVALAEALAVKHADALLELEADVKKTKPKRMKHKFRRLDNMIFKSNMLTHMDWGAEE